MISFAYPHLLYLLLLLPLVAGIFLWSRLSRKRKLDRYGKPEVIAHLMPDVSKYMPWVKISLALLIIAVLVIMISRPRATGGCDGINFVTRHRSYGMSRRLQLNACIHYRR